MTMTYNISYTDIILNYTCHRYNYNNNRTDMYKYISFVRSFREYVCVLHTQMTTDAYVPHHLFSLEYFQKHCLTWDMLYKHYIWRTMCFFMVAIKIWVRKVWNAFKILNYEARLALDGSHLGNRCYFRWLFLLILSLGVNANSGVVGSYIHLRKYVCDHRTV